MLTFATAVFFLLITPGPGVLSVAGVGSGYGHRAGSRYIAGLFIGTNLVALGVISGLAALILANALLRNILLAASLTYLVYLAWKIASAGVRLAFKATTKTPGIRDGIVLQALNPKAYAVNTTLFGGFGFMPDAPFAETLLKLALLNAIWLPIHFGWLYAGIRIHRMDLAPRLQRRINIAMALSMLLVVALALVAPRQ